MASPKLCLILTTCLLIGMASAQLSNNKFYDENCPKALKTIKSVVAEAVKNESRMGASLLRLLFHDCFVQGCDASVLLDDTSNFTGEKNSFPNRNSLRGFEVIDNIKSQLETACPGVVSCADILVVAAREAVGVLGGLRWELKLGRRDSINASLDEANSVLPGPIFNLSALTTAFQNKNFSMEEMVTLSGAHTIGLVRCLFFRDRIYNEKNIDPTFAAAMQAVCPPDSGDGDNNLAAFDSTSNSTFDNAFYINLVNQKGLVHSDQELYVNGSGLTDSQVMDYSKNQGRFKKDFAAAMLKMTSLNPLTGTDGQIRTNCRMLN